MSRRVNVNFSDRVFGDLTEIADENQKSLSDVLRDAVTLEKFVNDTRKGGGRVLLEGPDGEVRELLIR